MQHSFTSDNEELTEIGSALSPSAGENPENIHGPVHWTPALAGCQRVPRLPWGVEGERWAELRG